MTRDELIDQYFDWMYQLVVDDRYSNKSYRKLFARLYDTEFTYTIPMDGNRAEDGIDLRYRFGTRVRTQRRRRALYRGQRPRHAEHGNLVSDELLPARNHQGGRHLA